VLAISRSAPPQDLPHARLPDAPPPAPPRCCQPPITAPRGPARGGHTYRDPTRSRVHTSPYPSPPTGRTAPPRRSTPQPETVLPPHHPLSTPHLSPPSSRFHHSFSPLSYSGKNNSREPRGDSITRSKPVIGENKPLSVRNNGKER
jgi:hypothetical protein